MTPVFDAVDGIELEHIPRNKEELLAILNKPEDKREIYPKRYPSYILQNIPKWANKTEIYDVSVPRGKVFEPYFVTHRYTMLYEEMFNSYGYNKLSQVESMLATGHKLKMLPDAFMVHLSHGIFKNYNKWNKRYRWNKRYDMKVDVFGAILKDLKGFTVNSYYPPWLKNASVLDCSATLNPSQVKLLESVILEKSKIATLKGSLYITSGFLALILITVFTSHKKEDGKE